MKQAANYIVTAFTYDKKARTFSYLELNHEPVSLHVTDSYEDLQNLPMINGVTLVGDKSTSDLGIVIPTKLSQLENDPAFITAATQNLANYYLKTQTYDKSEVDAMIGALKQLKFEIVDSLPVSDISPTTIYLLPDDDPTTNVYFQYLYVNNDWALLGSTEVDLSSYYTKLEVDTLLADKLNSALETPVVIEGSVCSTVLELITAINDVKQSKTLSTSISYHGSTYTNLELFLQALAARIQLTDEDLDTVVTPGSYYATGTDSVTHKPTGISNFELTVSNLDSTKVFQFIKCYSEDTIYYRVFMSSAWSVWHHLDKDLVIDSSLDSASTNPVENKVVTNEFLTKLSFISDKADFPAIPAEGNVVLYTGVNDTGTVPLPTEIKCGTIYQYQTDTWVAISSAEIPLATTSTPGIVKPDGDTITVDNDGTIHAAPANTFNEKDFSVGAQHDVSLLPVRRVYNGTRADWDLLSVAEKTQYGATAFTDDEATLQGTPELITSQVQPGPGYSSGKIVVQKLGHLVQLDLRSVVTTGFEKVIYTGLPKPSNDEPYFVVQGDGNPHILGLGSLHADGILWSGASTAGMAAGVVWDGTIMYFTND